MKESEESLRSLHFFRGSKWYLINLAQVESQQAVVIGKDDFVNDEEYNHRYDGVNM